MSVARHTTYNLVGAIIPIGVTLLTVPLYLKLIGLERFGVLSLCWVFTGYFAFFDFGIGRATAQKMATLTRAPQSQRSRLFWTSSAISAGLAVLAALVVWPIGLVALREVQANAVLLAEAREALWLLVLIVPVAIVQSGLFGTLEGRRAFGPINIVGVVGNILTATLPLLTAWVFGPSMELLVAATLAARLFVLIALATLCARLVPLQRPGFMARREVSTLLKFGGWVTVSGVISPLLAYSDRLMIGASLGAAAAGFYLIGFNLVSQLWVLPNALCRALFPHFAETTPNDSKRHARIAFLALLAVLTPVIAIAVIFVKPFLHLWLNKEVAATAGPVSIVLLLGFWVNSLAFLNYSRIQALNRPDLTAKTHIAELIPYLLSLWVAMNAFGLIGAALAWSVRVGVDFLILSRLDGMTSQDYRVLLPHLVTLSIMVCASLFMPPGILLWALIGVLFGVALLISWRTVPAEALNSLRLPLRRPI